MFSSYHRKKLDEEELTIISTFKYMRVLKLVHSSVSRLSGSIEKLRHLRHLNLLTCYGLESLPKSIYNLVCLQTLKLLLDEKVILSANVVSKLKNLRHLVIYDWTFKDKKPTRFGKLSIQQHEVVEFHGWCLYHMAKYDYVASKRVACFYSSKPEPHQFSVLVRGIHVPTCNDAVEQILHGVSVIMWQKNRVMQDSNSSNNN
ncbi:unnamed protein product [Vicia faba]|uniref:Disease resistance R13L4/SHOC-2-like LRR domain-containing protein n=1 Tax=Vicia faba TaxID=3906 RepID=A0AAV1ADA7_VICFA|nr:unnamed protein product [Vicia faba]